MSSTWQSHAVSLAASAVSLALLLFQLVNICSSPGFYSPPSDVRKLTDDGLVYLGCYEYNIPKEIQKSSMTVSKFIQDLSLEECWAYCMNKHHSSIQHNILLVRGMYCGCMTSEDFKLKRVKDDYCRLECTPSFSTEKEFTCGGNYGFSVYCKDNFQGINYLPCEYFVPELSAESDYFNDEILITTSILPQPLPTERCYLCTDFDNCFNMLFTDSVYFPQNIPEACAKLCSQDMIWENNSVRNKTTYAVVGYTYKNGISLPVCACANEIITFKKIKQDFCKSMSMYYEIYCSMHPCFEATTTATLELTTEQSAMPTTVTPKYSATPRTTDSSCLLKCQVQKDVNGQDWTSCAGDTALNRCPRSANGDTSWQCSNAGLFVGPTPDYSNCSSLWQNDISIGEGVILEAQDAKEILDSMTSVVTAGENVNYFGHEILIIMDTVKKVFSQLKPNVELREFENMTEKAIGILVRVLINKEPWKELAVTNCSYLGTELINLIETTTFNLTARVAQSREDKKKSYQKKFKTQTANLNISCGIGIESLNIRSESYLKLSSDFELLLYDGEPHFVSLSISSEIIQDLFPPTSNTRLANVSRNKRMNGILNSFTFATYTNAINPIKLNFPGDGVTLRFRHDLDSSKTKIIDLPRKLHPREQEKPVYGSSVCVFWDTKILEWSSDECKLVSSNQSVTICECFHLTSFTVLMDMHNYLGKESGLESLTIIVIYFSAVCLALTFFALTFLTSTKSVQRSITKNLCILLMVGNTWVLYVVDRHYINMSDGACTGSAVVAHYFLLAVITWMTIECYHSYKIVVPADTSNMTVYYLVSYGLPLIIVGVTVAFAFFRNGQVGNAYGGEMFCWFQGYYLLTFVIPLAIAVIGITVTLIKWISQNMNARKTRKWFFGYLTLTIVLGLTWVIGVLVMGGSVTSVLAAYCFIIMIAIQAFLIFFFCCVLDDEVWASILNLFTPSNRTPTFNWSTDDSKQTRFAQNELKKNRDEGRYASRAIRNQNKIHQI